MSAPLQPEQPVLEGVSRIYPLAYFLQKGLDYIQQGYSAEAAALFALVREQLASSLEEFTDLLDAFLHEYANYKQIEWTLQEASMRFASAYLELQARMASLEAALSTMMRNATSSTEYPDLPDDKGHAALSLSSMPTQRLQGASSEMPPPLTNRNVNLAPLSITCFGHFEVKRAGKTIILCSNRNGQRILRYLACQPGRSARSDVLQSMLWPDDEAEVASRKLHLAISALRRSLSDDPACEPGNSYIVCRQSSYSFHPTATIQVDVDEFLHCYRAGQRNSERCVAWYERACQLYTGLFLPEDIYSDWSFVLREQCALAYLTMANDLTNHYLATMHYEDAIQSAHAVLKENRCDETAHQHLIQIYIAQGRRSEALQQYQRCEQVLREELGVKPLLETTLAIQALLSNDSLFT